MRGGGATLSAFCEVQPKHLGAGVSGTLGGGGLDEEFGETDEDDPGGGLIGDSFQSTFASNEPPRPVVYERRPPRFLTAL